MNFEDLELGSTVIINKASGLTTIGEFVGIVTNRGAGKHAVVCSFDPLGRPRAHICSLNGLLEGELGGQVTLT